MGRTGGAASASPPSASSPPAAPIPSPSSSSSPTPTPLASIGPAAMAIFTPLPPCILCAIDLSSGIYNIDGGGAPPLPKADPACATHTPRATAGASAGHGSPRAPAWLAMRRLPLKPEGGHTKNLAGGRGWDGSNVLRRRPRLHETNEQKQASMEGSSMHHLMLPPSSLTSLAVLEEGLEPRALPSSLSGSPADFRYPVPLSDPRQALFPSSVLYKKMTQLLGLWIFF